MDNERIYSSKKELLKLLEIKENFLYKDFSKKYSKRKELKKNGGVREIYPPSPNLKKTQRIVLDRILSLCDLLPCVYGLSKGKTVFVNASAHQTNFDKQLLILDIEDFFPSIKRKDVLRVFKCLGFNKENASILTKICTVDNKLPQGSPASPYIASLVCVNLDKKIYLYCQRRNFIYTRYFDDISISGSNISNKNINEIENIVLSNSFKCNDSKKVFFNFKDDKIINSIVIGENEIFVTEKYKDEIEQCYKNLLLDKSINNKRIYIGKLGFYLYINKKEAQKFQKKLKIQYGEIG